MFIVLAITQMLGVGTTTLISHAAGRKERERALLVSTSRWCCRCSSARLFFVVGDGAARFVRQRAQRRRRDARQRATTICSGSSPPWRCSSASWPWRAALRGTGNFKPGMVVQTATVILNMVLAPILIFGWGTGRPLGVAGAAIASLVAIAVGTVWLAFYFVGASAYLTVRPRSDWKPQTALWRRMLGIGLPAGAEFALMAVYLFDRLHHQPAVRRGGAGRVRHRHAHHPGRLHAGRRARLRGRAGRRPELRRAASRSACARRSQSAALMAAGVMAAARASSASSRRRPMVRFFSSDPAVVAVGAEYLRIVVVELRRVGRRVRGLEHVPGDGQHAARRSSPRSCASSSSRFPRSCCRGCRGSSCAGSGISQSPQRYCN